MCNNVNIFKPVWNGKSAGGCLIQVVVAPGAAQRFEPQMRDSRWSKAEVLLLCIHCHTGVLLPDLKNSSLSPAGQSEKAGSINCARPQAASIAKRSLMKGWPLSAWMDVEEERKGLFVVALAAAFGLLARTWLALSGGPE